MSWAGYNTSIAANRYQQMFITNYLDINGRLLVNSGDVSFNNGNLYVAGNVGIGMVANSGYELDVAGDVRNNGNLVVLSDTSLNSRLVVGSDMTINNRLFTIGDASLNGKLFAAFDTSLNGNLVIGKDLTIKGRLNVQNYTNTNIINTTVNNYQLIVSEDLSLNGRLVVGSDINTNSRLFVSGNVGIGTTAPTGKLHIYETTGTTGNATNGTIVLEHNNTGGTSSIIFKSKRDNSDYGYIYYTDDISGSTTNERSALCIGAENDKTNTDNLDMLLLQRTGGYVGIGSGNTLPTQALEVNGTIRLNTGNNTYNKLLVLWDGTTGDSVSSATNFYGLGVNSGTLRYQTDNTGAQHKFYCGATLGAYISNTTVTSTYFNATSDYRIKANVQLLNDTHVVDYLKPVTYYNKNSNKMDVGFIAHEIQEQFPFLVTGEKDGSEHQTLNYTGLIGILTKEIQDLKKENKVLRKKMENIEIRLSNM